MDGASTMTEIRQSFRTPLRILVPKILKSRDAWKAKSDRRKSQLKSAQIKVRDLTLSREHWRQTAEASQEQVREIREQLQQSQNELAQSARRWPIFKRLKKSSRPRSAGHGRGRAAATIPSRSFRSRCDWCSRRAFRYAGLRPLWHCSWSKALPRLPCRASAPFARGCCEWAAML